MARCGQIIFIPIPFTTLAGFYGADIAAIDTSCRIVDAVAAIGLFAVT